MNAMTAARNALNALTYEQLQEIIPDFKAIMKNKRAVLGAQTMVSTNYKFGDIISWSSKKRGRPPVQFLKFSNFNRAGTCVVGFECDEKGNVIGGKWTVATSFINK